MPYFDVDRLHISPDAFLEECSESDRRKSFEILINDYNYNFEDVVDDARGEGYRFFLRDLESLKSSWYSISKEDAEIINNLSKKYGNV